jgi:hypothetical protein
MKRELLEELERDGVTLSILFTVEKWDKGGFRGTIHTHHNGDRIVTFAVTPSFRGTLHQLVQEIDKLATTPLLDNLDSPAAESSD